MKKKNPTILTLLILLLTVYTDLVCQVRNNYVTVPEGLDEYLSGVARGNLGLIAARFNVSIAEAELRASRVFPDPELSFSYANNDDKTMQMGQSYDAGVSYQIKTGNVRKAAIEVAGTGVELSRLVLDSYFRNLRADAAKSYYASVREKHILNLQNETYDQLRNLAAADSIRLKTGEAAELDAIQTSLEARLQYHNVLQSKADMQNSLITLTILQGKSLTDSLVNPSSDFPADDRDFLLASLIDSALVRRTELLVALKTTELSEKNLNLLRADRAFEFSIEAGYSYSTIVKNEIAPAPAYNAVSAGFAFPLKFSGLNRGRITAAEYTLNQSKVYEQEAVLQIQAEVTTAYNSYLAGMKKVESFNLQLIENAEKILKGRIKAYQTGESGLLELLNARKTYTDLRTNHIESLYEFTVALIELERAAGIWDLTD
ncbi:MAG TPA: TolC family protein [Bacteroidales bacterium]|nr:TolC family protein [Bacteroidales bacterium]